MYYWTSRALLASTRVQDFRWARAHSDFETTAAGEDERFPLHAQGMLAVRARLSEHRPCAIHALVSHTERADV